MRYMTTEKNTPKRVSKMYPKCIQTRFSCIQDVSKMYPSGCDANLNFMLYMALQRGQANRPDPDNGFCNTSATDSIGVVGGRVVGIRGLYYIRAGSACDP